VSSVRDGLSYWDYLVVAAYAVWMVGIGLYYARRQTNLSEYFLGGRGMGWLIVGISTMATLVSTITYLTTPGEIVKNGFGVLWAQLSFYLAFPIIGYLVIPRIMAHKVVSGYQLLELQFGVGIRRAAAVLFVLTRISWVGMIVYTCSFALSAMTGWPIWAIMLTVGVVTTVYTVIGGIRAVIITDVAQAVVLFVGAVAVVIFAMHSSHSLMGWWPNLSDPHLKTALNWPKVPFFPESLSVRISVVSVVMMYFVWWLATACSDQLAIQRYLSTNNAKAARRSFLTNGIANSIVGVFLVLAGVALLGFFLRSPNLIPSVDTLLQSTKPEKLAAMKAAMVGMDAFTRQVYILTQGADHMFPWFIAHILPAGVSGLLLAALFSAAMSSVSSGVNSITTVLMTDFSNIFRDRGSEAANVLFAKRMGICVGAVCVVVSFLIRMIQGNFMEVAQKINLFFVAPMAGLFLMAFFMKRVNRQGAWASVFVSAIVGVLIAYSAEIFGEANYISFTYTTAFSLAASLGVGYAVSLLFPAPKAGELLRGSGQMVDETVEAGAPR